MIHSGQQTRAEDAAEIVKRKHLMGKGEMAQHLWPLAFRLIPFAFEPMARR